MSDRVVGVPTTEERIDDVLAVMAAAGSTRAALYGSSEGGAISALFVATYPEAVSHLVLLERGRSGSSHRRRPNSSSSSSTVCGEPATSSRWPLRASPTTTRSAGHIGLLERRSGTPTAMAALIRMNSSFDVRPSLSKISAPTLVLHRIGDRWYSHDQAREMADGISGRAARRARGDRPPGVLRGAGAHPRVDRGVCHRPPAGAERRASPARRCRLTDRELDVLELIAVGRTNRQVASELLISPETVSHHLRRIFAKTGSTNRTEASAYADQPPSIHAGTAGGRRGPAGRSRGRRPTLGPSPHRFQVLCRTTSCGRVGHSVAVCSAGDKLLRAIPGDDVRQERRAAHRLSGGR